MLWISCVWRKPIQKHEVSDRDRARHIEHGKAKQQKTEKNKTGEKESDGTSFELNKSVSDSVEQSFWQF